MLLLIDNYDSFTYNLLQYFAEIGCNVRVYRNDKITVKQIAKMSPEYIVISPGPGTPQDGGISLEVIKTFAGRIPILGVCLGHQCIGEILGGKVVRAKKLMHGKTSEIYHDSNTIFRNIPNPFTATRYHSLVVEKKSLPSCLEISAATKDGTIMGLRHKEFLVEGVQFHPESILTVVGKDILRNFLSMAKYTKREE